MSLLSGNVNLNNVNIRPDKVNEIFKKSDLPIALKAGLISKLSIKVFITLHNLFIVLYFEFVLGFLEGNCGGHPLYRWA